MIKISGELTSPCHSLPKGIHTLGERFYAESSCRGANGSDVFEEGAAFLQASRLRAEDRIDVEMMYFISREDLLIEAIGHIPPQRRIKRIYRKNFYFKASF
jgi:hypothetical protein